MFQFKNHQKLLVKCAMITLLLTFAFGKAWAQCAATVPTFVVNLTGAPDSTWVSPPTVRVDTCCGAVNPDRCVLFIVTLDTNANGIIMDIPEGGGCGARPTGSLFYQVNCGPQVPIGTPVCLSGPGPHHITFCKPGNNMNCYQITSFPRPTASGDVVSQDGCSAQLFASGYDEASLEWTSVPSNPVFESYLDCLVGCDTVTATYQTGAPAFVDYQVCGAPIGGCDTTPYCDTMRVFFVSTIGVVIQPDSPTVCFGSGTTNIFALPSGGAAPYSIQWLDDLGTPLGNADSLAVGPGTYIVQVTDTLNCTVVSDTVTVTAFSLPIAALPGNDSVICGTDTIPLQGGVQAASGGIWQGGTGTFLPNNSTLNAQYIPSLAEYGSGSVTLNLVTTGNGTCPPDSDAVTFTLSPRPQPLISGPNPVCENIGGHVYAVPAVVGHTYSWTATGGNIVSGQGTNAIAVFWNGSGSGSVSLTQTNALGCDTSVSILVTIHPKPNPVIVGVPPFCEWSTGNPYSVSNNPGSTYLWSVNGGTIASGQGTNAILVDFGTSGPATIQVTETNAFGCDTTVSISFGVNPNPDPILSGPDTLCAWTTAAVYSSPFVSGDSYLWSITGGNIASGQGTNSIQVDWGAAGTGSVQLTQTNGQGCDTTVSMQVTIFPNPVASIAGADSVCQFDQSVLYTTISAAGDSYLWSVAGGTIVAGQGNASISVNWGAAGVGQLSLVQTNSQGCDTTVVLPVVISPKPMPVISGNPPFCEFSSNIPYNVAAVAGDSYNWIVSNGVISSGQGSPSITVSWGGAGQGIVQVTQSNPLGCDTTVLINITIHPTPVPVISGPDSLCEFSGGVSYSTTVNPGNGYLWSVSGGVITSGQGSSAILVDWGSAGVGTVSVTESNPFGCDSTVSQQVVLMPIPTPNIVGLAQVCAFSTGQVYNVQASTGDSYTWTVVGGSITSGQGSPAITVDWGAAGLGSVEIVQTSAFGCDSIVTVPVQINPNPTPVISGPDTLCAYSNGIAYSVPNNPGNSYVWTVLGGTLASGQGTNAVTVNWGAAGMGSLTLLETNAFGCDSAVSHSVILIPNPPTFINGPDTTCAFSAETYSAANLPGHSYQWSVFGGTLSNGQGTPVIEVNWGAPGVGFITLVQTSPLGCDTTITTPIQILSAPSPVVNGPTTLCQYSGGHVYSTPSVVGVNYSWTVSGGTLQSGQGSPQITVQWDSMGIGIVTLYAISATGCDTTVDYPVTVLPAPIATIDPLDTFGCAFLEVPFIAVNSDNADNYFWDLGNGQSSTSPVIIGIFDQPGVFPVTLIVSNNNGCSDTANTSVFITSGPNAAFDYNPDSPINIELDSLFWTNLSTGSNNWYWDFGDGTLDTTFTPEHQYAEIGEYLVQLVAVDTFGCADTAVLPITLILDVTLYVPNAFTPNGDGNNENFNVGYLNLTEFQIQIFSRWGEMIYESFDPNFQWDGSYQGQACQEGAYVWKIVARGRNGDHFDRAGTVTLIR